MKTSVPIGYTKVEPSRTAGRDGAIDGFDNGDGAGERRYQGYERCMWTRTKSEV